MVEIDRAASKGSPEARLSSTRIAAPATAGLYSGAFWLIFCATFAINVSNNLFVLLPLLILRMGGSAATIGALMGTGSLGALLVRPAAGPLIDRFGNRRLSLVLLLAEALAMSLYIPLAALGWAFYGVRVLHGMLDGTARVALFALVYEILPAGRQGQAMATFTLSGIAPASFAPLAGEVIIRHWGFGALFIVAAALALVGAAALAIAPHKRALNRHTIESQSSDPPPGYPQLLTDAALMPYWIATLAFALALSSRTSFVVAYAELCGIRNVGWYFAIYSAVAVALRLSGHLLDSFGLDRALKVSLAVMAAGIGLIAGTNIAGMLYLAAAIGGLGHGFAYPALTALVVRHTGDGAARSARVSTIYTSLWDVSSMIGPYALGVIAHSIGYGPMFVIAGVVGLSGALYLGIRPNGEPRAG
jgi:MFS family permease